MIKDESIAIFIGQKAEKLASAVYRVTDSIHDQEPIKWVLRNKALSFMMKLLSFSKNKGQISSFLYKDIYLELDEIIATLEVSFTTSLVSQMNFSILQGEYKNLRESINQFWNKYKSPIELSFEKMPKLRDEKGNDNNQDFVEDYSERDENTLKIVSKKHTFSQSFNETNKGQRGILLKDKNINTKPRSSHDKEKRKALILDFIKKTKDANIKDILSIPYLSENYSEKTIQRELIDMVAKGTLLKKGERRWSRYFLP